MDPPIHIKFTEPTGDSELIGAVEGIIREWFAPLANVDPADIEDCAGNIVHLLQGWADDTDLVPSFVSRIVETGR